ADTFMFVLTPDSLTSAMCAQELAHAGANRKRIVSILHRDIDVKSLSPPLSTVEWLPFRERDPFDTAFDALLETLDTDLTAVRMHTRLLLRAKEVDAHDRDNSFLLRGRDLKAAEHWLTHEQGHQCEATSLQTQYVVASRRLATSFQTRVFGAISVGLLVA